MVTKWLPRIAGGLLLSVCTAGLTSIAQAQITPLADRQANAATQAQLAYWRKSPTTVNAQAASVDPVAFVDGGVIVFPLPDLQPVQLRLVLTPGRTSFTATSSDPRFVSAVITITDRVYVGIVLGLMDGGNYQLIPIDDGDGQHVIIKQSLRGFKDSAPSGNPKNEPLRWGPGGANSNITIQSVRPLA